MQIALPVILFFGLPTFMLLMFKANAGIMFLAACTGLVLLNNLDDVVVTTAGSVVPGEGEAYVRLIVVLLSLAFAGYIFRDSVKGAKTLLHGVIVLIIGTTLLLTMPEATGVSWLTDIVSESLWQDTNNYRALIITAGFALSLVALLTGRSKHKKRHK